MNKWKISYIIHMVIWIALCVLAIFYEVVALSYAFVMFMIVGVSYLILGFLTGATDPLAEHGGSGIPEIA